MIIKTRKDSKSKSYDKKQGHFNKGLNENKD